MPRIIRYRAVLFTLIFLWSSADLCAQSDELFRVTRNKDANEIIYHVNTDEQGRLDLKKPIEAYWIRYDLEGRGRSLTQLERKYAYGLKFADISTDGGTFEFVSFKRTLHLVRTGKKQFEVQTEINGKRKRLEEVYLNLGTGSFWFPKVNYIELRVLSRNGEQEVLRLDDF